MKLWLDDERPAPEGWVWVKTVYDAEQAFLNAGGDTVTELSVDHDLGETERPGYDLLVWLETAVYVGALYAPRITIHSMNAGARRKMQQCVDKIHSYGEGK